MKKVKKIRDFEYDYFPSILGTNFQSGLNIPFFIICFFGNERRSVPRLQLHLGDIAYKFVVLYLGWWKAGTMSRMIHSTFGPNYSVGLLTSFSDLTIVLNITIFL
jgi:hypothetical protein